MTWSAVLDQQRAVEALRRAIDRERVAHAYLFYGPDGIGKRAVALAFAQALQCEQAAGSDACGQCTACRKVQRLVHPDVHVLLPQPSDADADDVAERLQRLAAHPYAAIDFVRRPSLTDATASSNKQAFYSVGRIHEELRRPMSFRPLEGQYKVVVLTDAEMMRVEASNAFLKLLEEPGPRTVFVLTTSRPDRLLPTILSRCQRLRFDPLPAPTIEQALVDRDGLAPDTAATLARMADGSYMRALELSENDDLMANRSRVVAFMRWAYVRDHEQLADAVEEMSKLGREQVKGILRLMLSWIRDLMLFGTMSEAAPLVNVDQADAIQKFVENVPRADLEAMVQLVEEAMELAGRNVQLKLVLMALAHALGRAMHGPHDGTLYVPLAETSELALPG
ncbi:MAG: DNA polymerase III subunit delta' [Bacteroidetes bacterium]|jgi:DNA polymerase-3 subunit delta'|nr:DNA polymerase III subunit delta' [Bacteroidota bacterium]